MGQQIANDLQGVTIGGNYIGGNSVINDFNPSMEEHIKESNNKTIFLTIGMMEKYQIELINIYQVFLILL